MLDSRGLPIPSHRRILSDYKPGNLVKKVIKATGTLMMPENHIDSAKDPEKLVYLDPSINLFHHKSPSWHEKHMIDSEFLCPG